jgi:hypothetical protein
VGEGVGGRGGMGWVGGGAEVREEGEEGWGHLIWLQV